MIQEVKKCKICFSPLEAPLGKERFVKCPFCGCPNYFEVEIESDLSSKIDELYKDIRNAEFEKAGEDVNALIKKYPDEAELYFIKVLVDGKIIYVDDGEKKIPTYTSVRFDIDNEFAYQKALELAKDEEQRAFFERQFKVIKDDCAAIKQVVENKDPQYEYDVFISFKSSEIHDPSNKTKDAELADKVYKILLKNHHDLKVFYAPECLVAGENWERQIFNALYRSKCMIVIGSSRDNLNAPWVKNEWNRYLEMINSGKKANDSLIPIIIGGDFYNVLPAKLRPLQGLAEDISLSEKLSERINNIFSKKKVKEAKKLEVKEFEAFQGTKINRETHQYNQEIDINAIERMARADASVALNKLKTYDQDDPRVKEVRLLIEFGDYFDPNFYTQDLDKLGFYNKLKEIISEDNVNKFANTFISAMNSKINNYLKIDPAQFIISYYEYLSDENKKSLLLSSQNIAGEIVLEKIDGAVADSKLKKVKKLVDTLLSMNDISSYNKQLLLIQYCTYLYKAGMMAIQNKRPVGDIIKQITHYLDYIDVNHTFRVNSKYYDLASIRLTDDKWISLANEIIMDRTNVYAYLVALISKNSVNSCNDVFNLLTKCAEELTVEKNCYALVSINTLQMLNAFRDTMVSKTYEATSIDYYYNIIFELVANNFPDEHVKGTLECVKNIRGELVESIDKFSKQTNIRNFLDDSSKAPTEQSIKNSQFFTNIGKYDQLLFTDVCSLVVGEYAKHYNNLNTVVHSSCDTIKKAETYMNDYEMLHNNKISNKILNMLVSKGNTKDTDRFINFLKEHETDVTYLKGGLSKNEETKKQQAAQIARYQKQVNFNTVLTIIGVLGVIGLIAYQVLTLTQFHTEYILWFGVAEAVVFLYFIIMTTFGQNKVALKSLAYISIYVLAAFSWFMILFFQTNSRFKTGAGSLGGYDFGYAYIPYTVMCAGYVFCALFIKKSRIDPKMFPKTVIIKSILSSLTVLGALAPVLVTNIKSITESYTDFFFYVDGVLLTNNPLFGSRYFIFMIVSILVHLFSTQLTCVSNDDKRQLIIGPATGLLVLMVLTYVAIFFTSFSFTGKYGESIFLHSAVLFAAIPSAIIAGITFYLIYSDNFDYILPSKLRG